MKASELKLGNYCQDEDGSLLIVTDLAAKDNIVFYVFDRSKYPLKDGWKAEYIPITEKILINLGATKRGNMYLFAKQFIIISIMRVSAVNGFWSVTLLNSDGNNFPLNHIRFVHEVQNIYSEITKKQLNYGEVSTE